jgi:hypothetical protein
MLACRVSPRALSVPHVSRSRCGIAKTRCPTRTWHRASQVGRSNGGTRQHPKSVPRIRVAVSAFAKDDEPSDSSTKRTLSALDSLLGVDTPDPLDVVDGELYDEPAAIKVPIIYTAMAGKGAIAGGSLVGGALVDVGGVKIGATYIAITVGLPDRSTRQQREKGVSGIELDFCIDTACTTNFILPQVAYGLDVQIVGSNPDGVGATGAVQGGQEMLLGTAKLGSDADDNTGIAAITGLSAQIVQVPAPGTAGILGRAFLNCFAAVEFDWRCDVDLFGSVLFHQEYNFEAELLNDEKAVTKNLDELPCGLLSVNVTVNGISMPALIDTGAPQTIINRAAALRAGIGLVSDGDGIGESKNETQNKTKTNTGWNPFAAVQDAISRGREQALGSSGVVTVMGAGGRPERLDKAKDSASVRFNIGDQGVFLTSPQILVGELEAFRVGLGLKQDSAPELGDGAPGVVLGLDALMSVKRVVLRTTPGEGKMRLFL